MKLIGEPYLVSSHINMKILNMLSSIVYGNATKFGIFSEIRCNFFPFLFVFFLFYCVTCAFFLQDFISKLTYIYDSLNNSCNILQSSFVHYNYTLKKNLLFILKKKSLMPLIYVWLFIYVFIILYGDII